jgi:tetratricopeptide (TPR) repeat protein
MSEHFIPVQIYQEKDPDTQKKFKVRAFPTFVVTDAEGTELMRQVGAPFSTPKEATKWFKEVGEALENVSKLEAAHKEKPEDTATTAELAKTYSKLGKSEDALKLYEGLNETIKKEDKNYVEVKLGYADALAGTLTRSNQKEVGEKIGAIYDKVLPDLVKNKDERAIDPSIMNSRIKAFLNKKYDDARTELSALTKAFPKMERLNEVKFYAAYFAQAGGDTDTAKAEYQAIVDAGPDTDKWVKNAKAQLAKLK